MINLAIKTPVPGTRTSLAFLPPGTKFEMVEIPGRTGILVKVNECRAVIRLDNAGPAEKEVEFENEDGTTRKFTAKNQTRGISVTPALVVSVLGFDENFTDEESDMATKKKGGGGGGKKKASANGDGKLSQLDAAAKVLHGASKPMNAKELVAAMEEKGLWKSPGGKTPHATLSSAILREMTTKGKESRFVKVGPGQYEHAK